MEHNVDLLIAACIVGAVLALAAVAAWWSQRPAHNRARGIALPRRPWSPWRFARSGFVSLGISLLLVVVAMFLPRSFPSGWLVGSIGGGVFLYILGMLAWQWWRYRVVRRAFRLANHGQIPAALELIKAEIEAKGPSKRLYNALGVLYLVQQSWEEALRVFEEAEAYPDREHALLGNKGLALWKLGRNDEAGECLREQARRYPNDLSVACNLGLFYADIGQRRAALDQLTRADEIHAQLTAAGVRNIKAVTKSLDDLRKKVYSLDDEPVPPKQPDERYR